MVAREMYPWPTATAGSSTAEVGVDFTAVSGTLPFRAGQLTNTFTIPILDNPLVEPDETIHLNLSDPRGEWGWDKPRCCPDHR